MSEESKIKIQSLDYNVYGDLDGVGDSAMLELQAGPKEKSILLGSQYKAVYYDLEEQRFVNHRSWMVGTRHRFDNSISIDVIVGAEKRNLYKPGPQGNDRIVHSLWHPKVEAEVYFPFVGNHRPINSGFTSALKFSTPNPERLNLGYFEKGIWSIEFGWQVRFERGAFKE